jgi:hypothetical protein
MKKSVFFLVILLLSMSPCNGMQQTEELNNVSQEFYRRAREQRIEAQEFDRQMDEVLNYLTLGVWGRWQKRNNQPNNEGEARQAEQPKSSQTSGSSSRHSSSNQEELSLQLPHHSITKDETNEADIDNLIERGRRLDRILEKADDLSASSKPFLWQQKKQYHFPIPNKFIQIITSQNARTLYGLTSSFLLFYMGIKSLNKPDTSKKFSYTALFFGATGTTALLYDLLLKSES